MYQPSSDAVWALVFLRGPGDPTASSLALFLFLSTALLLLTSARCLALTVSCAPHAVVTVRCGATDSARAASPSPLLSVSLSLLLLLLFVPLLGATAALGAGAGKGGVAAGARDPVGGDVAASAVGGVLVFATVVSLLRAAGSLGPPQNPPLWVCVGAVVGAGVPVAVAAAAAGAEAHGDAEPPAARVGAALLGCLPFAGLAARSAWIAARHHLHSHMGGASLLWSHRVRVKAEADTLGGAAGEGGPSSTSVALDLASLSPGLNAGLALSFLGVAVAFAEGAAGAISLTGGRAADGAGRTVSIAAILLHAAGVVCATLAHALARRLVIRATPSPLLQGRATRALLGLAAEDVSGGPSHPPGPAIARALAVGVSVPWPTPVAAARTPASSSSLSSSSLPVSFCHLHSSPTLPGTVWATEAVLQRSPSRPNLGTVHRLPTSVRVDMGGGGAREPRTPPSSSSSPPVLPSPLAAATSVLDLVLSATDGHALYRTCRDLAALSFAEGPAPAPALAVYSVDVAIGGGGGGGRGGVQTSPPPSPDRAVRSAQARTPTPASEVTNLDDDGFRLNAAADCCERAVDGDGDPGRGGAPSSPSDTPPPYSSSISSLSAASGRTDLSRSRLGPASPLLVIDALAALFAALGHGIAAAGAGDDPSPAPYLLPAPTRRLRVAGVHFSSPSDGAMLVHALSGLLPSLIELDVSSCSFRGAADALALLPPQLLGGGGGGGSGGATVPAHPSLASVHLPLSVATGRGGSIDVAAHLEAAFRVAEGAAAVSAQPPPSTSPPSPVARPAPIVPPEPASPAVVGGFLCSPLAATSGPGVGVGVGVRPSAAATVRYSGAPRPPPAAALSDRTPSAATELPVFVAIPVSTSPSSASPAAEGWAGTGLAAPLSGPHPVPPLSDAGGGGGGGGGGFFFSVPGRRPSAQVTTLELPASPARFAAAAGAATATAGGLREQGGDGQHSGVTGNGGRVLAPANPPPLGPPSPPQSPPPPPPQLPHMSSSPLRGTRKSPDSLDGRSISSVLLGAAAGPDHDAAARWRTPGPVSQPAVAAPRAFVPVPPKLAARAPYALSPLHAGAGLEAGPGGGALGLAGPWRRSAVGPPATAPHLLGIGMIGKGVGGVIGSGGDAASSTTAAAAFLQPFRPGHSSFSRGFGGSDAASAYSLGGLAAAVRAVVSTTTGGGGGVAGAGAGGHAPFAASRALPDSVASLLRDTTFRPSTGLTTRETRGGGSEDGEGTGEGGRTTSSSSSAAAPHPSRDEPSPAPSSNGATAGKDTGGRQRQQQEADPRPSPLLGGGARSSSPRADRGDDRSGADDDAPATDGDDIACSTPDDSRAGDLDDVALSEEWGTVVADDESEGEGEGGEGGEGGLQPSVPTPRAAAAAATTTTTTPETSTSTSSRSTPIGAETPPHKRGATRSARWEEEWEAGQARSNAAAMEAWMRDRAGVGAGVGGGVGAASPDPP